MRVNKLLPKNPTFLANADASAFGLPVVCTAWKNMHDFVASVWWCLNSTVARTSLRDLACAHCCAAVRQPPWHGIYVPTSIYACGAANTLNASQNSSAWWSLAP
jgi:hypothetical protein